ncbi:MAG: MMPL family transporter [Gammaproteobacteria bacterium]|nr:MMPL family transporter [Gammaproteobacteria bacterium]
MKVWESTVSQVVRIVTKRPYWTLLITVVVMSLMSWPVTRLSIDASPDALLLENDPDLKFYRSIHYTYGTDEYVVVAIHLDKSILMSSSVRRIEEITQKFKAIEGVSDVTSITTVPLIYQSLKQDKESTITFPTLLSKDVDISIVENEFLTNPLYEGNLASNDLHIAAFKIDFLAVPEYKELFDQRYILIERQATGILDSQEREELEKINNKLEKLLYNESQRYAFAINKIRSILDVYKDTQQSYLSGTPLIANDMKRYVLQDIKVFGVAALLSMTIILFIIFHNFVWVLITLFCSFVNVLLASGLIGLFNFNLTVVSSNYVAILLIFSLAIGIHVVVRYQEEMVVQGAADFNERLIIAIQHISTPCLYMVLTSTVAFISLIISNIQPVIIFGYIMVIGLCGAYIVSFTILPVLVQLLKPTSRPLHKHYSHNILKNSLSSVLEHKIIVMVVLVLGIIVGGFGITKITVENRFIDYFKQTTDIHQGLLVIDQKLGGTVPIEIVLNAPDEIDLNENENILLGDELDEFDDYLAELENSDGGYTSKSYWYNRRGIEKIRSIHVYLEGILQIGKVLSLSSTESVFQHVIKEKVLDDFELSLIYSKLPQETKSILIQPYLSDTGDQTRIVARLKDSDHSLVRNKLLNKIKDDLEKHFVGRDDIEVKISGIGILYNNVLQSLYRSQILTIGFVFIGIFLMLSILFKSMKFALIAILPNIFTSILILGLMGILNIPLNIMTITIAAITIGIGVDDAIHYIHRYKNEYAKRNDIYESIMTSQITVGKALWFTSVTIATGFILLIFSNFMPTVYFGLFTCLAMIISIFATFTLIPLALSASSQRGLPT